jgi:hypothetical protein
MHIITRFLTWLLDLAESKIAQRNIKLNAECNARRLEYAEMQRAAELLAQSNAVLARELVELRGSARKADTIAIVSSDNVRGVQDKFNQLKRHGRALRYSIGQACLKIETIAAEIAQTRHACEHEAAQLRDITRQMRALGCIPPDAGSIPAKPEDFISDFHPSMLDDDPVDAFKPAREIAQPDFVSGDITPKFVAGEALDGVQDLIDRGRVKLNTHSPREPFKPSKAPFKFGGW